MFIDGEKFDVGKAEIPGVARKLLGEFAIGQPFVFGLAPPRTEMDLVDRHRCAERVDVGGRRTWPWQPCLVEHDGSRARPHLGGKGPWICLHRTILPLRTHYIQLYNS